MSSKAINFFLKKKLFNDSHNLPHARGHARSRHGHDHSYHGHGRRLLH
jgi:hypothetical protein